MIKTFTKANEGIVRIYHPVLYQELVDIAQDLNLPLQQIFNKFCDVIFEDDDADAILLKIIADLEQHVGNQDVDDVPF